MGYLVLGGGPSCVVPIVLRFVVLEEPDLLVHELAYDLVNESRAVASVGIGFVFCYVVPDNLAKVLIGRVGEVQSPPPAQDVVGGRSDRC